ncbi:MAG: 2-oxoacid:acceptor oxidoreductase family protein [Acidobacteriia bacterium]|nr:2-oxoacid:acceptor oxidoreductase family protein [Terriglobia bacterium]
MAAGGGGRVSALRGEASGWTAVDRYPNGVRAYGVPATRLAEELGRKVVLNIVMVGFFGAVTGLLEADALRKAVADSVPPAIQKLNLQAYDKGFEYGSRLMERLAENGDRGWCRQVGVYWA